MAELVGILLRNLLVAMFLGALIVSFVVYSVLYIGAVILKKNIPRWGKVCKSCFYIAAVITTIMFLVICMQLTTDPSDRLISDSIIGDLRSMKAASIMFYEDNRDIITEIPKGVNVCEYLIRYMDNPSRFNDSPYIFIISGDLWWGGCNLEQEGTPLNVRLKLAKSASVFGSSQPEPPPSADYQAYQYKESDAYVWLLARMDDGD